MRVTLLTCQNKRKNCSIARLLAHCTGQRFTRAIERSTDLMRSAAHCAAHKATGAAAWPPGRHRGIQPPRAAWRVLSSRPQICPSDTLLSLCTALLTGGHRLRLVKNGPAVAYDRAHLRTDACCLFQQRFGIAVCSAAFLQTLRRLVQVLLVCCQRPGSGVECGRACVVWALTAYGARTRADPTHWGNRAV